MKKMVCEICGSNEIVKKEGVFVCKSCGTQYTTEEAKKLLVEVSGKVEVSGTVKIDNSDRLKNLYQAARQAVDSGNNNSAKSLYEQIMLEDPDSWEAAFFTVYCQAMETNILNIANAALALRNSLATVFSLINKLDDPNEKKAATRTVYTYTDNIGTLLESTSRSKFREYYDGKIRGGYGDPQTDFADYCSRLDAILALYRDLGNQIESLFKNDKEMMKLAVSAWKKAVQYEVNISATFDDWSNRYKKLDSVDGSKIRKYESSYSLPSADYGGYPDYMIAFIRKSRIPQDAGAYVRAEEEARKKRIEEYKAKQQASQLKSKEEELQKVMEANSPTRYIAEYLAGSLIPAYTIFKYISIWNEWDEFPGILLTLLMGFLVFITSLFLFDGRDRQSKYKEALRQYSELQDTKDKKK